MKGISHDLSSYPYISSYTFRLISDHGWLSDGDYKFCKGDIDSLTNGITPSNVKEGDRVYVVTEFLDRYFKDIHPKIKNKYVLITGRCDRGIDNQSIKYLDDKIMHWFSSNCEVNHPKLTPIPLGLQNRHWRIKDHPQSNITLIDDVTIKDNNTKINDVLMSFQTHTNSGERVKCYDYFKDKSFVKIRGYGENDRINTEFVRDYFKEIKQSKFVICPFGGGFDCHRNWEVFSLGSFPIIKKHTSMENFYDMPAWFVNDWGEVNKETIDINYDKILGDIEDGKNNFDKSKFKYWYDTIKKIKK